MMYHTLAGRTDYDRMSITEKAVVHSLTAGIIGSDAANSGKLAGKYIENFMASPVHQDIREFAVDMAKGAGGIAAKGIWSSLKWYA